MSRGGKTSGSWKPSQSGNPGGRRSVTKALIAAGFDPDSLCAEVIQRTVDGFRTLDPGDKDEGQSWRWCADKAWVLVNLPVKPLEQAAETTLTQEEYEEELAIVAKEYVAKLQPDERVKLLTSPSTEVVQ